MKHRFRNSMKDVQADTDSDYNLLVGNICTKLKKIMKFQKGKQRWDLQKLHFRYKVQDTLEGKFGEVECEGETVALQWNTIKKCVPRPCLI